MKVKLNKREVAAVLAGLRLLECHAMDGYQEDGIADIATNGDTIQPLAANEVDDLCQRINTGG